MPKVIEYQGRVYHMPDDATDAEITEALEGEQPSMPPAVKAEGLEKVFPVESETTQAERDQTASKLRSAEVGHDPKEIAKTIRSIEAALEKRPMNADARKMLKRELSFWKTLEENSSAR